MQKGFIQMTQKGGDICVASHRVEELKTKGWKVKTAKTPKTQKKETK